MRKQVSIDNLVYDDISDPEIDISQPGKIFIDEDQPQDPMQKRKEDIARNTKIGSPIEGSWAPEFIKLAMLSKQNPARIAEIMAKFPVPSNAADTLVLPQIQSSVYKRIDNKGKSIDTDNRKNHTVFIKLLTAIAKAAGIAHTKYEEIVDVENNAPWLLELLYDLADALELGTYINAQEFCRKRRKDLTRFFDGPYKAICVDMDSYPPTPTDLLGEDLEKSIKTCDLSNKLLNRMMGRKSVQKGNNNNNNNNKGKNNNNNRGNNSKGRGGYQNRGDFQYRKDDRQSDYRPRQDNYRQRSKTPNRGYQKDNNRGNNSRGNNKGKY